MASDDPIDLRDPEYLAVRDAQTAYEDGYGKRVQRRWLTVTALLASAVLVSVAVVVSGSGGTNTTPFVRVFQDHVVLAHTPLRTANLCALRLQAQMENSILQLVTERGGECEKEPNVLRCSAENKAFTVTFKNTDQLAAVHVYAESAFEASLWPPLHEAIDTARRAEIAGCAFSSVR